MGTTAATGSPLRMMTVGLPFCARVITAAKWARTSRTFILLSSSVMVLMYPDLCTCRVPQASTTRLPSSVIARASLALAPSDLAEANAEAGTAQHPDEPQGRQDGARDHAADGDGGGKQEKHRGRLYGHPRRQPRGRYGEYPRPQPGRPLEEPVQPRERGRRRAQRHHLGGQLGHQWLARGRGPGEQDAQGQVGQRELEQEEQLAASNEHHSCLQRKHQGRDG